MVYEQKWSLQIKSKAISLFYDIRVWAVGIEVDIFSECIRIGFLCLVIQLDWGLE